MKLVPPAADEFPLIYDTWARSFMKSPWAGCVRNCDYPATSRAAIQEILDRGARVVVAVVELEGGGRRVMGYSVSEPGEGALHWIYVKRDYRGMGVGKALLADVEEHATPHATGLVYTYRTPASAKFLGAKWRHDPVLARVKR